MWDQQLWAFRPIRDGKMVYQLEESETGTPESLMALRFRELRLIDEEKQAAVDRLRGSAREERRLWRVRAKQSAPDIWTLVRAERELEAIGRERFNVSLPSKPATRRTAAVIAKLQSQLHRLWRRSLRRCQYPACAIPGGRLFVGKTKDCPRCRNSQPSRKTRYRHRQRRPQ
jgi:hypothetical protein